MLVVHMWVSSDSDRQSTHRQRDALLVAEVEERYLFQDNVSGAISDRFDFGRDLGLCPSRRLPCGVEARPTWTVAAASPGNRDGTGSRESEVSLPHRTRGHHHAPRNFPVQRVWRAQNERGSPVGASWPNWRLRGDMDSEADGN